MPPSAPSVQWVTIPLDPSLIPSVERRPRPHARAVAVGGGVAVAVSLGWLGRRLPGRLEPIVTGGAMLAAVCIGYALLPRVGNGGSGSTTCPMCGATTDGTDLHLCRAVVPVTAETRAP